MDLTQLIKTKAQGNSASGRPLNIVLGTSEVVPYSKTGGLADASAAMAKALGSRGHRVTVVTPLYGFINPEELGLARRLVDLSVPRRAKAQRKLDVAVWEHRLAPNVTVAFIDAPEYFKGEDLYGYDGGQTEQVVERFAFFSRSLVEFCAHTPLPVDILHLCDWHTALAPVYKEHYSSYDTNYATVLALHNIAFQGGFHADAFPCTGLPKSFLVEDELGENDDFIFLKGGIKYADAVTTVSPNHAKEIVEEPLGFGRSQDLKQRPDQVVGILNGVDYSIWSPETDAYIPVNYSVDSINGKRQVKTAIQHSLGLPVRPTLPLLGFVGRLTTQKGVDILIAALRQLLSSFTTEREGFQVALLGQGDPQFQEDLTQLQKDFPSRVTFVGTYSESVAHKLMAASDILLIPSRFEPCGLTQLYAQRYGTIPIVTATGGLLDTVVDRDEENSTGYIIKKLNVRLLTDAIERATTDYHNQRQWRPMMARAMSANFSWNGPAKLYESLFYKLLKKRGVDVSPITLKKPSTDPKDSATEEKTEDKESA